MDERLDATIVTVCLDFPVHGSGNSRVAPDHLIHVLEKQASGNSETDNGLRVNEGRLSAFRERMAAKVEDGVASSRCENSIAWVVESCDESFPRRRTRLGKKEVY